jgi:hypothetical protein
MAASQRYTIDSTYEIPDHLSEAAEAKALRSSWRIRTPVWQRFISFCALGGIAGAIGIALAVALIGVAVFALMLLEAAIG